MLFLDEPTTGLDLLSRNELWDMIRELVAEGTTVLLTTQYLEEADRLASRSPSDRACDRERLARPPQVAARRHRDRARVRRRGGRDPGAPEVSAATGDEGHVELEERKVLITTPDGARL